MNFVVALSYESEKMILLKQLTEFFRTVENDKILKDVISGVYTNCM